MVQLNQGLSALLHNYLSILKEREKSNISYAQEGSMAGKFNSNLNNISLTPTFLHGGGLSVSIKIHNEWCCML